MKSDILIVLGSKSDYKIVERGLNILDKMECPYELRIASAHRSFNHLHSIVQNFENNHGKMIICVAGKSAHLGGVVAAITLKPVFCVPVYNAATSGMDALLSMSQMPQGIPTATMGFGGSGFANACLQSLQILALNSPELTKKLKEYRLEQESQVKSDDKEYQRQSITSHESRTST